MTRTTLKKHGDEDKDCNCEGTQNLFVSGQNTENITGRCYAVQTGHCKLIFCNSNIYLQSPTSQLCRRCSKFDMGSGL